MSEEQQEYQDESISSMSIPLSSHFQVRKAGPPATLQPYIYKQTHHRLRKCLVTLLVLAEIFIFLYAGVSIYIASRVEYSPPLPITKTPAAFGLEYHDVTFPSRIDHLMLRGWFIPGALPDGGLTTERTIIMVHGTGSNRAAPLLLELGSALAKRGFAILAFDMRGMGQSAPAPLSEGYFEQRDVLGAVDFLRSGSLPYPTLGRPRHIAAWGDSMGAATVLLAAAQEPAIEAIVSDSGFAALVPVLQQNPAYPGPLIPSVLFAIRVLYGVDFYAARPVDVSLDYTSIHPLLFGFLASSGALAGDALKSFLKRQAGIAPGKTWFPFDQLDYVFGGIAFTCLYVPLSLPQYLLLVLVWFLLHPVSTFVGYELRLKESPI